MPYDPTRNPLPPLNDGYPDDWHVPPSAQDDSFPDDWYVPPSAQPNAANLGFTAPPGSIASYWSRLAADRQRTAPWAPPMFPDTSGGALPSPFAPAPLNLAPNPTGLFGNRPNILDWQQSSPSGGLQANAAGNPFAPPTSNLSTSRLFGGTGPAPAGTGISSPDAPTHGLFGSAGGLSSSLLSDRSDPSNVSTPLPPTQDGDQPGSDSQASPAFLRSDATPSAINVGFSGRTLPRSRKPAENSPLMARESAPYSPNMPDYHEYEFEDYLCDIGDPGCSIQNAYDGLLRHAVPGNPEDGTPIENDKSSEVALFGQRSLFGYTGGSVITKTEPESSSIVNITQPGHFFESGIVQRQIVQRGNKIYIRTHGLGNNLALWRAGLNKFLAPAAFLESTNGIRAWIRGKEGDGQ